MTETVSEKVMLGFLVMEGRIRESILSKDVVVPNPVSELLITAGDSNS